MLKNCYLLESGCAPDSWSELPPRRQAPPSPVLFSNKPTPYLSVPTDSRFSKGPPSIGQSHYCRSHFHVGLLYQCAKGCNPTASLSLRIVDHTFTTSDFEVTILSRRLVSHLPFLKVRGSNLDPETGNTNYLRYCPNFFNKPSAHTRFPIHFTAPRGTICCGIKVKMKYIATTSAQ